MIRQLGPHELPTIHHLVAAYGNYGKREFNPNVFDRFWNVMLAGGSGIIFVDQDENDTVYGALGGLNFPSPYNNILMAQEIFWCVLPEHKGHGRGLFKAFEKWCKDNECHRIIMTALANEKTERLSRFYERLGYRHLETNFIKEI